MKEKKVHYIYDKSSGLDFIVWDTPCSTNIKVAYETTGDIEKVTCDACRRTKIYQQDEQGQEQDRPLEKGEFEEPKKLNIYPTDLALVVDGLNSEQFNKLFDFIDKKTLIKVSSKKNKTMTIKQLPEEYQCVLDFINNGFEEPEFKHRVEASFTYQRRLINYCVASFSNTSSRCIKGDEFQVREYSFESQREMDLFVAHVIEKGYNKNQRKKETKTQLDLDAEKYNLNEEQKEHLSGFDYEVVGYVFNDNTLGADNCKRCLFNGNACKNIPAHNINCGSYRSLDCIIFKQIHKTQSSLNKSIEKPEVLLTGKDAIEHIEKRNESFESVADVVDEVINNKQPSKYHRYFSEGWHDCYSISRKYNIIDPAAQHGFKKSLMPGDRGAKDIIEDVKEILWSYQEYLTFLESEAKK